LYLLKKLRSGSTFLIEILDEGTILYADREFYTMVMKVYEEVRKKYVKKGRTWIEKL